MNCISRLFKKGSHVESKWLPGPVGDMLRSAGIATTTTVPLSTKLVTTTTHVGLDLATGKLVTSSLEDEFTAIIVCLDAALQNAGVKGGLGDAHKITAYLIDPADEPTLQKIFRERYPGNSPAWGTVIVPAIVVPNMRAEVQAEAMILRSFVTEPYPGIMAYEAKPSADGYTYTKKTGLVGGLRTYGVIQPEYRVRKTDHDIPWEAIVIGAGYAGLTAARDLVKAGKKTLLLEARDRVGGRTWSAEVDGTTFEMGGTWVSHVHGRLFAEMERYGLKDKISMTRTENGGCDYFTLDTGSGSRKLTHKEAAEMTARAWRIFIDIDGNNGRDICPLPHSALGNSRVSSDEVKAVDQLSCRDRINQIKDQLTADELALLESLVPHCGGGSVEDIGFLEMLRAQALGGYDISSFEEIWTLYKIREGQSTLARCIFDDAVRLGLQYSFKSPIKAIAERQGIVSVISTSNKTHRAQRVINTIPIAVLPDIHFDPPLSPLRQEAIKINQVDYLTKIHAEVEGDLRGLRGCTWPGDFLYIYGDGFCAGGKSTRITSFAGDNRGKLDPLKEPERLETALQRFHPMEIKKVVFHDWVSDPYAKAGAAWYSAGFLTKYLAELQKRHGNVLMANADWAHGWKGFIEGAVEQGALAADTVLNEVGVLGANAAPGENQPELRL